MKKAVVILSGGLDSTVLTYWLKRVKKYQLYALSFDYGQRHKKELKMAKKTCKKLQIPHKIIKLDIKDILNKSALIDTKKELPKGHYTPENQKVTVVPNRNMIMLSLAVAFAENLDIKEVYYAAHKNDYAVYPDCRKEFVKALSKATQLGTYNKVKIIAPFVNKYKWQLVKIGHKIGVPFEDTQSCYVGGKKACGKCATCQERLEAFSKNNLTDPIKYE